MRKYDLAPVIKTLVLSLSCACCVRRPRHPWGRRSEGVVSSRWRHERGLLVARQARALCVVAQLSLRVAAMLSLCKGSSSTEARIVVVPHGAAAGALLGLAAAPLSERRHR